LMRLKGRRTSQAAPDEEGLTRGRLLMGHRNGLDTISNLMLL
jgi:hypothetical protein